MMHEGESQEGEPQEPLEEVAALPPEPGDHEEEAPEDLGPHPDGISKKQEAAIVALLNEPTIPKAAASANVASRTLYRWMRDPTFARAYRKSRREAFGQATAMTQKYAVVAVSTLVRLMTDTISPAHVRVTAAVALLRFGHDGIELDDLAGRVEQLEQAAGKDANGHLARHQAA